MILATLQKLRNNVGDLGKIILTTIFKWLPKVQKIAQSGHTAHHILSAQPHASDAAHLNESLH